MAANINEYPITIDDTSDKAGANWGSYDPEHGEQGNFALKRICRLLVEVSQEKANKLIPLYDLWQTLAGKICTYYTTIKRPEVDSDIQFPNNSDKIYSEYQRSIIFSLKGCIAAYYGIMLPDFLTLTIMKAKTRLMPGAEQSSAGDQTATLESIGISYGKTDDNLPDGIKLDTYKASGLSDDRWV